MLFVVSGPDRVGKTTLIENMCSAIDEEVFVQHHSAPPRNQEKILDIYREALDTWDLSGCNHAIFDRAWPCTYILEQLRNRNIGFLEEVLDFEIELHCRGTRVVHIGQFRPWWWSAPKHMDEINSEMLGSVPKWARRAEYITRMQEHEQYSEQLIDFYDRITMFPSLQLNETVDATEVIKDALKLSNSVS
jgi:GTPase SAR1 family protein